MGTIWSRLFLFSDTIFFRGFCFHSVYTPVFDYASSKNGSIVFRINIPLKFTVNRCSCVRINTSSTIYSRNKSSRIRTYASLAIRNLRVKISRKTGYEQLNCRDPDALEGQKCYRSSIWGEYYARSRFHFLYERDFDQALSINFVSASEPSWVDIPFELTINRSRAPISIFCAGEWIKPFSFHKRNWLK